MTKKLVAPPKVQAGGKVSTKATKGVKAAAALVTPEERYEVARRENEARTARHAEVDRRRNSAPTA